MPRDLRPSRSRRQAARKPARTERDSALDRLQAARAGIARKSLWLKRGSVALVALAIGFGVLQEWTAVRLLAIPLAAGMWWFDAGLTCQDERFERLFDDVFGGTAEPPLPGDEAAAASRQPEPPRAQLRAMLSGPGAGLHWMMAGVAVLFNVLA